ncbi:PH domain-containing protein [Paenibacillus sp. FSL H8-0537]|uniref:PH domain-containing protein n=1 Tax=Paenibacillus sp. FSL H8-0537 TaxID=2921399 RepID=UPI003100D353
MNRALTQRVDRDYVKVSRMGAAIAAAIGYLLVCGYAALAISKGWTLIPLWIGLAVVTAYSVLDIWVVPSLRYRHFQYELFEEELELQYGLIIIKNVLVPMVRVQHVELESGPLMRKFKLASVAVVTAATTHRIKGLKLEKAEELKRKIGQLAKVDDQHE